MRDVPQSQRNRHFFPNHYINGMDQNRQRLTKNLRELAAEIEQEIRALEQ
jgi:hypothetical protein